MIKNISSQNIYKPQTQNLGLKKIVSQINANAAKKQDFDKVELSKKALALLNESDTAKRKEEKPIIDHENTNMVHSECWGEHTKAEFAEMSLDAQRDDLKTLGSMSIDWTQN